MFYERIRFFAGVLTLLVLCTNKYAMSMPSYKRTALFRGITPRVVGISRRRVGTTFRTLMKMGPVSWPETSVMNYHYSLCNSPEERSSHPLRGGCLTFCPITSRNTQTYKRRQKGARLFRCSVRNLHQLSTERNRPFS